jgi:conjugative relaxase-like TrwC/TraI family protein
MSIKADRAGSYARYLESRTVAPERGDYYLGPTSEAAQAPGRWHTDATTLARLGIAPNTPVEGKDFIALMEGKHPKTGEHLRPEGAGGGRGGGIDLTFSAPKSVSVTWAIADPWQREQVEHAHTQAVARTLAYLRANTPTVRRRYSGQVVEETAQDILATEYLHTTARGVTGAETPDPQIHSHVVITGTLRDDDRFVAVASRPLFRAARELGAYYRSALAQELHQLGYQIEPGTGKEERYFEIAGVPASLRDAFSGRTREVAREIERFRAQHGRAPEPNELRALKLANRRAKQLTTRADLDNNWRHTAAAHGFGPAEAAQLLTRDDDPAPKIHDLPTRVETALTTQHAIFEPKDLRAAALEQAVGELQPDEALAAARDLIRERRILPLQDGKLTTLTVRAQEQKIERHARKLAEPADRDVGETARTNATREVAERLGASLSDEQQLALLVLTGPERGAALIGPAGTGKGVVIDAAARAEQLAGNTTIGVAVAGSTRERLERNSPSLAQHTFTVDSLLARIATGSARLDEHTTVFFDEAGMADTDRLHRLINAIHDSGAKLVAVGDGKQLPAIGPGGMFDRITERMPVMELNEVWRTQDPDEQRAWSALRRGEPERAMAHYRARGQLHLADDRDEAAERAVQAWAHITTRLKPSQVALIADATNAEIHRLNARAQHLRLQRGELGELELELPDLHYGLREGDRIAFTRTHRTRNNHRVDNGTRGEVTNIDPATHAITIAIDGTRRTVTLTTPDLDALRLGYAQHINREQGTTVERSVVLTGGWQTSKESSYVQATRVKEGTDWYLSREELGTEGTDAERIDRLAEKMRESAAQVPSILYEELADPDEPIGHATHLRALEIPTAHTQNETNPEQNRDRETDDLAPTR